MCLFISFARIICRPITDLCNEHTFYAYRQYQYYDVINLLQYTCILPVPNALLLVHIINGDGGVGEAFVLVRGLAAAWRWTAFIRWTVNRVNSRHQFFMTTTLINIVARISVIISQTDILAVSRALTLASATNNDVGCKTVFCAHWCYRALLSFDDVTRRMFVERLADKRLRLYITRIEAGDEGRYTCEADVDETILSAHHDLNLYGRCRSHLLSSM